MLHDVQEQPTLCSGCCHRSVDLVLKDVYTYSLILPAWFLYDYTLTLPDEIRYVWWRRFSSVKLVFLGMRYAALANLLHSVENFGRWYLFSEGVLEYVDTLLKNPYTTLPPPQMSDPLETECSDRDNFLRILCKYIALH